MVAVPESHVAATRAVGRRLELGMPWFTSPQQAVLDDQPTRRAYERHVLLIHPSTETFEAQDCATKACLCPWSCTYA